MPASPSERTLPACYVAATAAASICPAHCRSKDSLGANGKLRCAVTFAGFGSSISISRGKRERQMPDRGCDTYNGDLWLLCYILPSGLFHLPHPNRSDYMSPIDHKASDGHPAVQRANRTISAPIVASLRRTAFETHLQGNEQPTGGTSAPSVTRTRPQDSRSFSGTLRWHQLPGPGLVTQRALRASYDHSPSESFVLVRL